MKQFKIDNIIVFGKSYKPMCMEDLNKIEVNPTNEYHILRHFDSMDEKYKKLLVGKKYQYYDHSKKRFVASTITEKDVLSALKTKGGIFYKNIKGIENPKKILFKIKKEVQKRIKDKNIGWISRDGRKIAMFTINYKVNIGDESLIQMGSLADKDKRRVKKVPRGSHEGEKNLIINTITGIKKRPTNIISVEINQIKNWPFYFITAYPGDLAPDFPNTNQSKKEQEYNRDFWKNRVSIV